MRPLKTISEVGFVPIAPMQTNSDLKELIDIMKNDLYRFFAVPKEVTDKPKNKHIGTYASHLE